MNRSFDVLIPAHGESTRQLNILVDSILAQDIDGYKLDQIILCSDNPTILKALKTRCCVTTIEQPQGKGKPHAWNLMLAESWAEFCIQNSADCLPASHKTYDWLLHRFHDEWVGGVTGRPKPSNAGFMFLPNIIWRCHHFVQPKVSGELFAFRTALVHGLPETVIHDDAYIHHLIRQQGFEVVYEPNAVVWNVVPISLDEYWTQRKKNVIGNLQLQRLGANPPHAMRLRSLVLMGVELLANVRGRLDYVRGKIPEGLVGYNLPSTKEVLP